MVTVLKEVTCNFVTFHRVIKLKDTREVKTEQARPD